MNKIKFPLYLFIFLIFTYIPTASAVTYQIEKVKGNVYRFVSDRHRSAFLVTDVGIILIDPLNKNASHWLKAELKKRFDVPVRYVIYSHNHSDHIYGGEVFQNPETIFIAHELAVQDIELTKAKTVIPTIKFSQNMNISLGENTVELRYHGPNDGRGSISVLFQPEQVLFVADWIVVGRMPWRKLWSYDIQGMINSTKQILELNFDIFIGAHADVGNKSDVQRYAKYLQELYLAVIEGIHSGMTLEQLKKSIKLENYSNLKNYNEWLPLNIEGVYERLMEESGMGWRPDLQN